MEGSLPRLHPFRTHPSPGIQFLPLLRHSVRVRGVGVGRGRGVATRERENREFDPSRNLESLGSGSSPCPSPLSGRTLRGSRNRSTTFRERTGDHDPGPKIRVSFDSPGPTTFLNSKTRGPPEGPKTTSHSGAPSGRNPTRHQRSFVPFPPTEDRYEVLQKTGTKSCFRPCPVSNGEDGNRGSGVHP